MLGTVGTNLGHRIYPWPLATQEDVIHDGGYELLPECLRHLNAIFEVSPGDGLGQGLLHRSGRRVENCSPERACFENEEEALERWMIEDSEVRDYWRHEIRFTSSHQI